MLTSRHKMQTCWVWSLDAKTSKIEKSHDDPYLSLDFDLFSFFLFCSLFLLFLWLSFAVAALALATLALFNALFSGVLSWFLFFLGEEPTPPNPLTFHLNIVSTLIDSNYHSHSHWNVKPSPDDERYPVKRGEKITDHQLLDYKSMKTLIGQKLLLQSASQTLATAHLKIFHIQTSNWK